MQKKLRAAKTVADCNNWYEINWKARAGLFSTPPVLKRVRAETRAGDDADGHPQDGDDQHEQRLVGDVGGEVRGDSWYTSTRAALPPWSTSVASASATSLPTSLRGSGAWAGAGAAVGGADGWEGAGMRGRALADRLHVSEGPLDTSISSGAKTEDAAVFIALKFFHEAEQPASKSKRVSGWRRRPHRSRIPR